VEQISKKEIKPQNDIANTEYSIIIKCNEFTSIIDRE